MSDVLREVNKNLDLILKQFYELHERVRDLEKERNSLDNAIIRYGVILLVVIIGVLIWTVT